MPRLNHEDCKGLAGIGVWILEKQIILILTHGHRKVAVLFLLPGKDSLDRGCRPILRVPAKHLVE